MKTLYYYLAIALFATCLVACEKKPVPEPEPEKKNEYTAGQVTKEIKSAAFYYSEESHGYTIHLFDSATPNFQDDDFNRSTYYTVNAFTFDIHANGIGAKRQLPQDYSLVSVEQEWELYCDIYDSAINDDPDDYNLTGTLLINITSNNILTVEADLVDDTTGIKYKVYYKGPATKTKYYLDQIDPN